MSESINLLYLSINIFEQRFPAGSRTDWTAFQQPASSWPPRSSNQNLDGTVSTLEFQTICNARAPYFVDLSPGPPVSARIPARYWIPSHLDHLPPPKGIDAVQNFARCPKGFQRAPAGHKRVPRGAQLLPCRLQRAPAGHKRPPLGTQLLSCRLEDHEGHNEHPRDTKVHPSEPIAALSA